MEEASFFQGFSMFALEFFRGQNMHSEYRLILIQTNIIGTVTPDHCTFDKYYASVIGRSYFFSDNCN